MDLQTTKNFDFCNLPRELIAQGNLYKLLYCKKLYLWRWGMLSGMFLAPSLKMQREENS